LLLEFPSVVNAAHCAIEFQTGMAARNEAVDEDHRIIFRIGINLGDIIIEGDDILGDGVNIAARLQEIAAPGGIAISARVHEDIQDRLETDFEDTGEQSLKNIARPVRVWQWTAENKAAPVAVDEALQLPSKSSIVVLPFNNMSGAGEQDYFSDGITEDITTELSRYSELFVIARNTAFTYKGQNHNILEIAQELGVHFVLEGSVRKAGDRVRINAQLIDGQNGSHLWAERFDGGIEEIFDLQDEVTHQVVSATVPQIAEAELARMRRGERIFDAAYDLAWQARGDLVQSGRQSDPALLDVAKEKSRQAIAMNERCLAAYATLCIAYWVGMLRAWTDDPEETLRLLDQTARKYVSLNPNDHFAHFSGGLAHMMSGRGPDAIRNMRHSNSLNPNDTFVLSILANVEAHMGHFDEAKAHAEQSIRRNPKGTLDTGSAYLALSQVAYVEDGEKFRHFAEMAIQHDPTAPLRRAMMIAHAVEIGDETLLQEHWQHLNRVAPRFLADRLENRENRFYHAEAPNERILAALEKVDLSNGALKSDYLKSD
ncbi:MAG: guanylyl cyclase, partial [Rhodospirillaceae bacterium]|nr:guanylyl cyclase [Rhodospirillaceae bacterium]